MLAAFKSYRNVEKHIVRLIVAECFIQLINAAFMIALLVYMEKLGYSDDVSAHYQKYRFLGVLALAIPIGIYIRGRKIKPLLYLSTIMVPVSALLIIYSVEYHKPWLIYLSHLTWGAGFVFMQVGVMPYILRNASKATQTEAISLSHSTWSIAGVISGLAFFILQFTMPQWFDEKIVMQIFGVMAFCAFFIIYSIDIHENLNDPAMQERHHDVLDMNDKEDEPAVRPRFFDYDWGLIAVAMIPTTLIAVGAGLTIPFISLFFYKVHRVDTDMFSVWACVTMVLVSFSTVLVPHIKRKLGYKLAIPLTQSVSIMALVGLASTELFAGHYLAPAIAIFFYVARQPLMNMAAPMTSEVTMNYVGKKNQEMVSALTASIWSGGWYISSLVFESMRKVDFSFATIFLVTGAFYAVGVFSYHLLTVDCERKGRLPV
ncbi:MAG TPA: MFS transporter [Flavobacteriales bacterium]|nr:MFS transporter [Flavobacteriales bacterium]